jgi:hypothetical protein
MPPRRTVERAPVTVVMASWRALRAPNRVYATIDATIATREAHW